MAKYSSKRNRWSRSAKGLWRCRVVGLVAAAGAALAFGMSPLASAPTAHADLFDDLIDVVATSAAGSAVGAASPADFVDLGALSGVLTDLSTPNGFDALLGMNIGQLPDAGAAAITADPFNSFVQGLEQDWINSPLGQQVDNSLNAWFNQADLAADPTTSACGLICNGADGTGGGTLAEADGQGGGLFLGNGGDGVTDAAGQGGNGGEAGWWGNGGAGGAGADGAAGGNGGAGGLFDGNGGNGGTGGNGTMANPAGGAGGAGGDTGALSFFSTPGDPGSPGTPLLGSSYPVV